MNHMLRSQRACDFILLLGVAKERDRKLFVLGSRREVGVEGPHEVRSRTYCWGRMLDGE